MLKPHVCTHAYLHASCSKSFQDMVHAKVSDFPKDGIVQAALYYAQLGFTIFRPHMRNDENTDP